jgi:hypothetical protein
VSQFTLSHVNSHGLGGWSLYHGANALIQACAVDAISLPRPQIASILHRCASSLIEIAKPKRVSTQLVVSVFATYLQHGSGYLTHLSEVDAQELAVLFMQAIVNHNGRIQTVCVPNAADDDFRFDVFSGILLRRVNTSISPGSALKHCRTVVFGCSLDKDGDVGLLQEEGLAFDDFLSRIVRLLENHNVEVLFCQKGVHSRLKRACFRMGIQIVERFGEARLQHVAEVCGCRPLMDVASECKRDVHVGHLDSLSVHESDGSVQLRSTRGPATLLVSCYDELAAGELEAQLQDCSACALTLLTNPLFLDVANQLPSLVDNFVSSMRASFPYWDGSVQRTVDAFCASVRSSMNYYVAECGSLMHTSHFSNVVQTAVEIASLVLTTSNLVDYNRN